MPVSPALAEQVGLCHEGCFKMALRLGIDWGAFCAGQLTLGHLIDKGVPPVFTRRFEQAIMNQVHQ